MRRRGVGVGGAISPAERSRRSRRRIVTRRIPWWRSIGPLAPWLRHVRTRTPRRRSIRSFALRTRRASWPILAALLALFLLWDLLPLWPVIVVAPVLRRPPPPSPRADPHRDR